MKDSTEYMIVQSVPDMMGEFLEKFDMEGFSPFVSTIKPSRTLLRRTYDFWTLADRDIPPSKSSIFVSVDSPSKYSWPEFYNTLVCHEGVHAQQNYFTGLMVPDTIIDAEDSVSGRILKLSKVDLTADYQAYCNQADHPSFSECSEKFRTDVYRNILEIEDKLSMF